MQVRILQTQDFSLLRELWLARFADAPAYLDFLCKQYIPETKSIGFGSFAGEELLSMAFMRPATYRVDGKPTPAVFIYGVATAQSHARQGLMHKTMHALLSHAAQEGAHFAMLRPAQNGIYESLGFRPATYTVSVPPGWQNNAVSVGMQIMSATPQTFLHAYCHHLAPYNFAALRTETEMRLRIAEAEADGGNAVYFRFSDGADGYILYHEKENHLEIDELAAPKAHTYSAIEYLCSKHNKEIHAALPPDISKIAKEQIRPQNLYLPLRSEFACKQDFSAYCVDAYS